MQDSGWEWKRKGACATGDPDEPFVASVKAQREFAHTICPGCPVRTTCLTYSLDAGEQYGVWGGLTEAERRTLLARAKRRRAA